LKAIASDTVYRINLEETEGAITLIPDYFTAQSDTSLLWRIFVTDTEIDSLALYTFKNPIWKNPEEIVKDLKSRLASTSFDWNAYNLREGYLFDLFNQEKYFPDTLLRELIKKRIHWYHFKPEDVKTAVINPSKIACQGLENKETDSYFYLTKIMGDTVSVHPVHRTNDGFYLTKSDFISLDTSAPSKVFRSYALVVSEEKIQHPSNAGVLYYFNSPVFIELADIKKDIKFLKKKLKLKELKEAEELQKRILMTEYDSRILWFEGIMSESFSE
jgi:hypothetical protein